jgi:hypothetical protein
MPVRGIVSVLVSWNGAILCLLSSCQACSSGPSFHRHSLMCSRKPSPLVSHCCKSSWQMSSHLPLQFESHLSRHPTLQALCRTPTHIMDNMVSWTMTDVQHGGTLFTLTQQKVFPHDVFCPCVFKVSIWPTLIPCVLCPQHCYISSLYFLTLLVMSIYKYRTKKIFMPFSNFSHTVINYLLLHCRMYCKTYLGAARCFREEGG